MIFEVEGLYIDLVKNNDIQDIVEVYNSNTNFLHNHMNIDKVTAEWMAEELDSMKEVGFVSCKVVEKSSGKLVGTIDFKIGAETYLSLLIIHNDYKNKGIGRLVYQGLEEYAKAEKSMSMRIDVVTNYSDGVLNFWTRNGFEKCEAIELNWTGKALPAIVMRKHL